MSPNYLSPGIYIEERAGSRPIEPAGTSVAAFIGFTEKRPEGNSGEPFLVTNWTQYSKAFGGFIPGAYLPHSVYGYFLNGGSICYIQSVATAEQLSAKGSSGAAKPLQIPGKNPSIAASLEVQAQSSGSVTVTVEDPAPGSGDDVFKLTVKGAGDATETFDNVTLNKGKGVRNVVDVVNKESKLIKLKELDTASAPADRRPPAGTYQLAAPAQSTALAVTAKVFQGDVTARAGLEGLESIDDVTIVCIPDVMTSYQNGQLNREDVKAVQSAVMNHCEKMKDRVAVIDALPDLTAQQVNDWRMVEANFASNYAAFYYPWIWIANPLAGQDGQPSMIKVPPSGHIAGVYARVDTERGVHKAPANEVVRGAVKLETNVTKGEQDLLNPNGVNCIRTFPGRGILIWGARTLSSDPSWRYLNVRRLFCMIEKSIERGTQWVVFEPNDAMLWSKVRRDVTNFLTVVWRSGALFGLAASESFFVKCDAENNPQEERDLGRLYIDIGIAPVKPAEFVVFRIGQLG